MNMGLNNPFDGRTLLHLPEENRQQKGYQRQPCAGFADEIRGERAWAGENIEDVQDKDVVAGMKQDGGPEAVRFEAQPGQGKTDRHHQQGEHDQTVDAHPAAVVIAGQQEGKMPEGPDQA